jgi:primosomal replication protein N
VNRLVLTASLVEIAPLRYTPAGLSAADVLLEHESEQKEAGVARLVKASLRCRALGELAERIIKLPLGSQCEFEGFLASPRNSRSVVFHLTQFNQIS